MSATAMRMTEWIEPCPLVKPCGLHDQSVAFPLSNRVSVPRGLQILGKITAVNPDRPPVVIPLHELENSAANLDELHGLRILQGHRTRKSLRIANQNRVIILGGRNPSRPETWFRGVEFRLPPRRHRRDRPAGDRAADPFVLPYAREIMGIEVSRSSRDGNLICSV